jgi:hypothetical protein
MSDCLCFNTLILASSGTIPTGTPAVVVEQFELGSAVSAAVYTPYGSSNPLHPLSFQNGSTWWV